MTELTNDENQLLTFISEGLSNQKIAERLDCSVDNIKTSLESIYKKLGVINRAQAVIATIKN